MANKEIHYMSDNGTMFWPATTTTAIIDPTSRKILSDILDKKVSVGDAGNIPSTVLPPVILESINVNTSDITVGSALIGKTYYHPDTKKIRYFFDNSGAISAETTDPSPELIYYNKATDKFYRWDSTNLIMVEIASSGGNISEGGIQEITWSALKTLRDGGNLTPGQFYRITDYTCTTTQTDTHSAGHVFDIIVFALSESILSEEAWADHHEGDTYFSNCNLAAWELKYCLDNDTTRFMWADTTNGKGVIYWMKDEWGNECPYDFKNIQFKRNLTDGQLDTEDGTTTWVYTFNLWHTGSMRCLDASVIGNALKNDEDFVIGVYSNKMGVVNSYFLYYGSGSNKTNFVLPDNVFLTTEEDRYYYGCYSNTLGNNCSSNTFGDECSSNTLGNNCSNNTLGNSCYSNTLGNSCRSNTFGDECSSNTLGNNCSSNTFGDECSSNTLGNDCSNNTLGNSCYSNTLGNSCYSNIFGIGCYSNTLGNNCSNNTLGNSCSNNTFSKPYTQYVIIENGNNRITLTSSQTPTSSNLLRNITIAQGVNNRTDTLTISHNTLNDTFQTIYKPVNSVEISVSLR